MSSRRCNGNVVERFGTLYEDHSHDWRREQQCAANEQCIETVVDHLDWALCTAEPIPDPLCEPATGTRCLDGNHRATCFNGMRVAWADNEVAQRCPDTLPFCVEPEPGVALCVADPAPSSLCIGQPARRLEVCAYGSVGCTEAAFQQYCPAERTGVLCFHYILIRTTECPGPASFDPDGLHCVEIQHAASSMCSN